MCVAAAVLDVACTSESMQPCPVLSPQKRDISAVGIYQGRASHPALANLGRALIIERSLW